MVHSSSIKQLYALICILYCYTYPIIIVQVMLQQLWSQALYVDFVFPAITSTLYVYMK